MAGFPYLGLLRELCQLIEHWGHVPLASRRTFPSSHAGLNVRVRLPVAVFLLACRKSIQPSRSSYALSESLCPPHSQTADTWGQTLHGFAAPVRIPPLKSCRWWRRFSPQMRINRFVFLNLPVLSLGTHLGLTTSPHVPLPTGSSPCQRTAGHRRFGSRYSVANSGPLLGSIPGPAQRYSRHAQAPVVPSVEPPGAGRTVHDVAHLQLARALEGEAAPVVASRGVEFFTQQPGA